MSFPTTRRFPRSLSDAFPDSRAVATEGNPHRVSLTERISDVLLAVAIGVVLAVALAAWWSAE